MIKIGIFTYVNTGFEQILTKYYKKAIKRKYLNKKTEKNLCFFYSNIRETTNSLDKTENMTKM